MPVKIKSVMPKTIADKLGLRANDVLVSINNHSINDIIDYRFYQADEVLRIKIERNNRPKTYLIKKGYSEDLGLEFHPIKYRRCNCNCIFCFVDQMHPQARPSLKIKDDDFRLSFLFGNFITLTNLSKSDYLRIVNQHLSPLYISVHTTNDELRRTMMRYRVRMNIREKLRFLADNGIQIHAQIVLVPGWNDGTELERTVFDLAEFYPSVQSIAIVPVGLTKFRKGLTSIKSVDENLAKKVISDSVKWRERLKQEFGIGLVTLSDEFFLLANEEIPEEEYYDDFPQIENGVGMTRKFLADWETTKDSLKLDKDIHSISLITAELIYSIIRNLALEFQKCTNIKTDVIKVENEYLGNTITVTGLLSGRDIIKTIKKNVCGDLILLPENMFNTDGLTLDGKAIDDLGKETGKKFKIMRGFANI
jgi:putative radical SAM enzyme (TIGR03279 family)